MAAVSPLPEAGGLSFCLHGLALAIHGAGGPGERGLPEVAAAIGARLARLPDGSGLPDLRFDFVAAGPGAGLPERPAGARPVYDPPGGEVVYSDREDLLYIGLGERLAALCEPARNRARVVARAPRSDDLWLLSHPLFTLPLAELAKRRGLYSLHAAGLALGGRGLLLPGTSGAGKSTLAVALARAGCGFLGDDTLFLAPGPGGLRVLAFPDEVDLTEESAGFFPDLAPHLTPTGQEGWKKRQLAVERLPGAAVVWECRPGVLVFPRVSGRAASRLSPLSRDAALLDLAGNVLLTERRSSQAHLDALAALVAASDCYRLETGRDLDAAARLLRSLLA
jgi:hypothetical protein